MASDALSRLNAVLQTLRHRPAAYEVTSETIWKVQLKLDPATTQLLDSDAFLGPLIQKALKKGGKAKDKREAKVKAAEELVKALESLVSKDGARSTEKKHEGKGRSGDKKKERKKCKQKDTLVKQEIISDDEASQSQDIGHTKDQRCKPAGRRAGRKAKRKQRVRSSGEASSGVSGGEDNPEGESDSGEDMVIPDSRKMGVKTLSGSKTARVRDSESSDEDEDPTVQDWLDSLSESTGADTDVDQPVKKRKRSARPKASNTARRHATAMKQSPPAAKQKHTNSSGSGDGEANERMDIDEVGGSKPTTPKRKRSEAVCERERKRKDARRS